MRDVPVEEFPSLANCLVTLVSLARFAEYAQTLGAEPPLPPRWGEKRAPETPPEK